jgi:hypothetical protein
MLGGPVTRIAFLRQTVPAPQNWPQVSEAHPGERDVC